MKYYLSFLIFMSGATVAENLTVLIGFNLDYVGAWWKVALAGSLAVISSIVISRET